MALETNGRINVSKADMESLFGFPRGVKFIALNETQHGYSMEIETDGTIDARGFLQAMLQKTRLARMTPAPAKPEVKG